MASYAATATYFESGLNEGRRIRERNEELLAIQSVRRRGAATPEFFFAKHFDNTRLVKAPDPVRVREMRLFSAAVAILFSLVMVYGLQHFYAIEGGYRVESEKLAVEQLREENRQLRLTEAQLSQPARIDAMARHYGLADPAPGQVIHPDARSESGAPVVARMNMPQASLQ